jgi:hypothetical protein
MKVKSKNRLMVLIGLTAALLSPAMARAQAWLPPKGEAWLSLGYGNTFATKHYFGVVHPGEIDAGHMRGQAIGLQMGYGVTDRFELSVGIPFVSNKYYCTDPSSPFCTPHPSLTRPDYSIDNGLYHGTFQDYRINVGYQLFTGEIAVAPFATAVIPSHDYVYFAHSAPGKGLHQYLLGFNAGASLDRILPGSYVQASYDYAFVEHVLGINLNRSDFGIELGYFLSFLSPSLGIRFLGTGYYTHGGLAFVAPPDLLQRPNGLELFYHHDQIGKARAVNLGGGLSYLLTGSTEIYATYLRSVYGRDGVKIDQGISFGVTWNFSPLQIIRQYFPPKSESLAAEGQ